MKDPKTLREKIEHEKKKSRSCLECQRYNDKILRCKFFNQKKHPAITRICPAFKDKKQKSMIEAIGDSTNES